MRIDSWTPEEDEILRKNFERLGKWGVAKLIPRRSADAIRHRAGELALSTDVVRSLKKQREHWNAPRGYVPTPHEIAVVARRPREEKERREGRIC